MRPFNRINEFFESDADNSYDLESDMEGDFDLSQAFEFTMSFPDSPDQVRQKVDFVDGKIIVSIEFVFDDIDLFDDIDEE